MASKRNKLLIFLGLVTVAVSKSHNQRFDIEYEFESQRTSASKLSAKSSRAPAKKADFQYNLDPSLKLLSASTEDYNEDYPTVTKTDDSNSQTHEKLTRRSSGNEYDHMPYYRRQSRFGRRQKTRRSEITDYDSDPSVEIDPRNFFFEAKKINSLREQTRMPNVQYRNSFSRRTGLLIPDTENPNPDLAEKKDIKVEEKKTNVQKKESEQENTSRKEIPKKNTPKPSKDDTKENKKEEKAKPKRKKVLRLRVRGQNNNRTRKNDIKIKAKSVEKIKSVEITSSNTEDTTKGTNDSKISDDKLPLSKNPPVKTKTTEAKIKIPKPTVQNPPVKSKTIEAKSKIPKPPVHQSNPPIKSKTTEAKIKIPKLTTPSPPIKNKLTETKIKIPKPSVPTHTSRKNNVTKETVHTEKPSKTNIESKQIRQSELELTRNRTKHNETENDEHIGRFFRRSGKKLSNLHGGQTEAPKLEWVSVYKPSDDQNLSDSSYVMSFNYMGNKNHPTDVVYIPQRASKERQSKYVDEGDPSKSTLQETADDYPQEELNIAELEKFAGRFIERKRKVAKYDTTNQNAETYGTREKDIVPIKDDKGENEYIPKDTDTLEDTNDQDVPQPHNFPAVTRKRKKNRKQADAIWKLQKQRENSPIEEDWKQPAKETFEIQNNPKTDKHEPIQNSPEGLNYFVQSFMKLPSGDKTALNIKDDEVLTGKISPYKNNKEFSVLRKPLLPLENTGNGNYFMHMYKQVGNVEGFEAQSGENPLKNGYVSSLKLSWNDDDTKARVEEAVDSRFLMPTLGHPFSIESSNSEEDSSTDIIATEASENIMESKPHYIDDFMKPLMGDKSYFSDNIPIHRRKRSAEDTPRVTSHFKIGESNVENNYTLENKPAVAMLNKRLNQSPKNVQIRKFHPKMPTQTHSRNAGESIIIADKQKESNVKSYYHKPVAEKEIQQLKTDFKANITNLFDKYEMPSRSTTYTHIFHSYQAPKRNLEQSQDSSLRFNNGKPKIRIQSKAGIKRRMDLQLNLKKENGTTSSSTTSKATMIQSSTDINASYMKPDKAEIKNKVHSGTQETNKQNLTVNLKRIQIRPTTQAKTDQTTVFQTTTLVPTTQINTQKQFFHKSGDLKKAAQDPVKYSIIKLRRISDQSWIQPQHGKEVGTEQLQQDVEQHLKNNNHERKQVFLHANDIPEHENQDLQSLSHGITPEVPFEWNNHDVQPTSENDYPAYHSIPRTHFSCKKRTPGYYADPETGCQVFHMCHGTGVKHSFLCPNTTIFNQRLLVCDWHSKVNCDVAESFYDVNDRIYEYQSDEKSDQKPQNKKHWNTLKPKKNTDNKYLRYKEEKYNPNKYQSKPAVHFENTEVTDVPQFIVNHFKENIPNAEFDKPKGITKSYSTVIGEPESEITSTTKGHQNNYPLNEYEKEQQDNYRLNDYEDRHRDKETKIQQSNYHLNEYETPIGHDKFLSKTGDRIETEKYNEDQKPMKNSWDTKEMQKTMEQELLTIPESAKTYEDDDKIYYIYPLQQNSHHEQAPEKGKSSNLLITDTYSPTLDDRDKYLEDDEIHFAGRQNEKVVVVNRERLPNGYESTSSQDFPETKEETQTKFTLPMTTVTQSPYKYENNVQNERKLFSSQSTQDSHHKSEGNPYVNQASRYPHNGYNTDKKQSHTEARAPQYIYPLPGIIENDDGTKGFNYGYRVEDPKIVNSPKAQIFKLNEPRMNSGLIINHNNDATRDSKTVNSQRAHISQFNEPRAKSVTIAKQNVPTNTVSKPYNLQKAHVHQFEEQRSNVGLNTKQSAQTPNSNNFSFQNGHIFKLGEPRLNMGINQNQNADMKIHSKPLQKAQLFKQEEPRSNIDFVEKHNSDMGKIFKPINLQTAKVFKLGEPRSNTNNFLTLNSNSENDSQAKHVKLRISQIKSGVESIGAQVGNILGGNDNTFKNIRVFKLQPHKSKDEFQEIKLTPFKFERNPRIPTNLNEGTKERTAFNANKDFHGTPNKGYNSNVDVKPIINVKNLNSETNVNQRSPNKYGHTQLYMAIPKLIHQVTTDIAPKFKEMPKQFQKPVNINKNYGELRSYNQMIKTVPNARNPMISNVRSSLKPINIYNYNNKQLNPPKILLRTEPRITDPSSEGRTSSKSSDESNKKYEIRYIPVIKLDPASQMRTYDKQPILEKQKPFKIGTDLKDEQSEERYEHIYVPKKLPEGQSSSFFIFPQRIKIHDSSEEFRGNPAALKNVKYPDTHLNHNIEHTINNAYKHESVNSDNLDEKAIEIRPTTRQNTDNEPLYQTTVSDTPKNTRTFVVISKPGSDTQSKKSISPTPIPVMTTISMNINTDHSPSTECDDSESSVQNAFTPFNLGKNGPPHDAIKSPLTVGPYNGLNAGEVKSYYNPQDESTSKCRDQGDSKVQNPNNNSPELDARQKIQHHKTVSFYPKPTPKITLKDLKRPKYAYMPGKTLVKYNAKSFEKAVQKSPHVKPIKLFQLQRNSRPAFMAPMTTPVPILAITTVQEPSYQHSQEKTEELSSEESRETSEKISIDRSKRVANGRRSRYADLEREAELRTTIKNPINLKKYEKRFPAARNKPQAKILGQSSAESRVKSNNHSRQSRYAALEKAAELEAERMLKSKSTTAKSPQ